MTRVKKVWPYDSGFATFMTRFVVFTIILSALIIDKFLAVLPFTINI